MCLVFVSMGAGAGVLVCVSVYCTCVRHGVCIGVGVCGYWMYECVGVSLWV